MESMGVNEHTKSDQQKSSSTKQSVSFFGLFAAADKTDYLLMFIGSLGAIIHGAALPVFFVLFGRMIDSLGHLSSNPHKLSSRISEVICNSMQLPFVTTPSTFFLFQKIFF